VQKTGDQQMQGDLTVSRAGGTPPADYVTIGNATGSDANSFVVVNNGGKQLAMVAAANQDPALITMTGNLFGVAKTPANNGTLALQEGIAPAFSASSTYAVGDYCTHDGLLYKCSSAVSTAGAWNSANWEAVAVVDEMGGGGITGVKLNGTAITPDAQGAVDVLAVPWANAAKNAVTIGTRSGVVGDYSVAQGINVTATGSRSHAEGDSTTATEGNAHAEGYSTSATGISSHAEGRETTAAGAIAHAEGLSTYAAGRPSHSEGEETTAAGIASHADGYRAVTAASGKGSGASTPHDYAFAWQGVSTGGYYRSHGAGTYNVNPVGGIGGFYVGEQSLGFHLNALPYASTTTLAPETAVYRATATLSGTTATMPTVTITGIPTAAAYFAFELEVAVDATATAIDDTAWSGWTWMDGGALPTSDYAGKTLFIACRLDCTARTIKANCYEVA
jgi:hypothetical protein